MSKTICKNCKSVFTDRPNLMDKYASESGNYPYTTDKCINCPPKYQSGDATREQLLKELNIDIAELKRGLQTVKGALLDLAQEQATRELSGTKWLENFTDKLLNETKIGVLVQLANNTYTCTCGGTPKYVGSEWKWKCPDCGAKNY